MAVSRKFSRPSPKDHQGNFVHSAKKPEVVHECERCLATLTPAESGQKVNVTGEVECKVCGHIGPLRIRIIRDINTIGGPERV